MLTNIGLTEGSANSHPGQGTSNRRFFFTDLMLELIYVRDAKEAAGGPGHRLHLVKRLTDKLASPFGLIVRTSNDLTAEPFPGWRYYPEYLNADQYLYVGENCDHIDEPLCIHHPFISSHPTGRLKSGRFDNVTEVRISFPSEQPSPVLKNTGQCEKLSLIPGRPHLMEIIFNGHQKCQSRDLRPALPLVVSW